MLRCLGAAILRPFVRRLSQKSPELKEVAFKWNSSDNNLASVVLSELIFRPNFVSATEESSLVAELDTHLSKHRYEDAHWDYVSSFNCALETRGLPKVNTFAWCLVSLHQ